MKILNDYIKNRDKEFAEKMHISFAKGGFLTTDADGSWQIDGYTAQLFNKESMLGIINAIKNEVEKKANENAGIVWTEDILNILKI